MSLHLIESTKVPTRSSRKRFGATASIALHATLVVGAFTAASAAPVVNDGPSVDNIIYVAPEPPKVPARATKHAADASPSRSTTPTPIELPVISAPIDIPMTIPPINTDFSADLTTTRDFSRRSSGSGDPTGTGTESNYGTAPSTGVFNDLQVDRQVTILSGYRTPRYPEMLRSAGVEETLNATFVVDTLGRVEAGSLEIPAAQHALFVVAVREALANARFRPAESAGRRVRQRVAQAFVFSLQRD